MAEIINLQETTDESLMARVRGGDHEAFSTLVKRHTKMFYAAAYRMCSNPDEAEDIVQDAFLKLWNNPAMWDGERGAKFTTWFYRVVTNQAVDAMRKKKKTTGDETFEFIADGRASQQETMEQEQQQTALEGAIQSLPERQKMALNLCFYEGLSNKEAAEIIGVGLKGLESLLMRAKAGLRDELIRRGLSLNELTGKEKGHRYG